jgi:hypothetical protein
MEKMMKSTDVLKELRAKDGRYIKRDFERSALVLREADGSKVLCTNAQGQQCLVIIPIQIFDSLVASDYVGSDGNGNFRLTTSGIEQADLAAARYEISED